MSHWKLYIKVGDARKMKLTHKQRLKVTLSGKGTSFIKKIYRRKTRDEWYIDIPLDAARNALLHPRENIRVVLEELSGKRR